LVSGMKETTGCSKEKGMIYVQWLWASGWKPSVGGVGFFVWSCYLCCWLLTGTWHLL
jgi:hypothetical protein